MANEFFFDLSVTPRVHLNNDHPKVRRYLGISDDLTVRWHLSSGNNPLSIDLLGKSIPSGSRFSLRVFFVEKIDEQSKYFYLRNT
jgi:hypothetical protein